MDNRTNYDSLRKFQIADNPNRYKDYTTPLEQYLNEHNVDLNSCHNFIQAVQGKVISPFSSKYEIARKESDNAFE